MHSTFARSPFVAALVLATVSVGGVGCASADGSDAEASSGAALASATKTFIVPVDERARLVCHDEINRFYCDAISAKAAAATCAQKLGVTSSADACAVKRGVVGAGCVRYETQAETCVASAPVYATPASCTNVRPKSCHFYSACLEAQEPCGADGYAVGYGERFCYAFKNASFSAKGQAWRDNVMQCLQNALVPELAVSRAPTLACAELTDVAFGSHPACYTETGHSICYLPPSDLAAVFGTIGLGEALKARTLDQMRRVVGTCIGQIGRRILFGRDGLVAGTSTQSFAPDGESVDADGATPEELDASYAFWAAKADEYKVSR